MSAMTLKRRPRLFTGAMVRSGSKGMLGWPTRRRLRPR